MGLPIGCVRRCTHTRPGMLAPHRPTVRQSRHGRLRGFVEIASNRDPLADEVVDRYRASSNINSRVSDACHPSLRYFGACVYPGVPCATAILLICGLPFSSPVTAVIVTPAVMSVPALVMNALRPLITHSSPSPTGWVLVPAASDPASGSVRPNAHNARRYQGRQPALLLLTGPELHERRDTERDRCLEGYRATRVCACHLFHREAVRDESRRPLRQRSQQKAARTVRAVPYRRRARTGIRPTRRRRRRWSDLHLGDVATMSRIWRCSSVRSKFTGT